MSAAVEATAAEGTTPREPREQEKLRKRCSDLGIAFWFVCPKSGKKRWLKVDTLRWRIAETEAGRGKAFWKDRGAVAAEATDTGASEPEAEPEAHPESTEAPAPAAPVAPAPVPSNGDAGAQMAALIRTIAGGAVDEAKVRAIVAESAPDIASLRNEISAAVEAAIKALPAQRIEVAAPGAAPKEVKGPLPAVFAKLVKLASLRQNVLMVGPAGCGKTFLAGKVAEALSLPFHFISCSAGMSEGQLSGRLLPVAEAGRFVYVPAPFVTAYEGGGVFLLDELDSADANTLTFLNAALANGHLSLPHRPEKPVAERHADFVCLAAANTYGHGANRVYAGRNQLDGATLDRFRAGIVNVDYDVTVEESLVDSAVLSWGRKIRERITKHGLRRIMSTRAMLDFTRQKRALGYGHAEWEESYFADWPADERAKVEA